MKLNRELFNDLKIQYDTQFPHAKYDVTDWNRFKYASSLFVGNSVIDIGAGSGVLLNYLAKSEQCETMVAMDISEHTRLIKNDAVNYILGDIRKQDFLVNDLFDTVFCMEVIEHCNAGYNQQILQNLRGITLKRLVITVPFYEPSPVWWHDKPGGHRQRFTMEKLAKLFPRAIATIEQRYGVDWIFIIEDISIDLNYFQIVSKEKVLDLLNY